MEYLGNERVFPVLKVGLPASHHRPPVSGKRPRPRGDVSFSSPAGFKDELGHDDFPRVTLDEVVTPGLSILASADRDRNDATGAE